MKNSSSVCHFWEERLKEVSEQEILYTVGMRGVHDGQMQGAKTVEEQKAVLERVLKDQRTSSWHDTSIWKFSHNEVIQCSKTQDAIAEPLTF